MVTASRILGDPVGSTAPLFLAFLAVHVIAGLTAVITGAVAALARKGSPRHIRAGRVFYRAITVVFATATALAVMRWRQDYHLFITGAIAFAAATIGYLHRRRHRPGDTGHITGMGIGYTAMLTARTVIAAFIAAIAAIVLASGCGGGPGELTTVHGYLDTATVYDTDCSHQSGDAVTVADANGNVLASASLSDGAMDGASCRYSFTAAVPLSGDSYVITIGQNFHRTFTKAQMEAGPGL